MRSVRYALLILFLAVSTQIQAANRFWVATGPANWNNIANWSTVSGGAPNASVPGAGDVAIFDNNGTGNCTLDINVTLTTITVNSGYTGTLLQGANTITTTGAATFSGGTFSGGTANITVGGVFTLSGTSFTATSAALEFRNNTAFTSGTFNHNNGSVRYNCAVSITISGTSPILNNLEFVGTGRTFTISSTGNITVLNSLSLSGSSAYTLNTGTIDVNGDINVTNTATGCGGNALINIVGTGTQNYSGSGAAGQGTLPQLAINKSAGVLNLSNFPGVSNNFTYTAGTINAGTSTFCFARVSTGAFTITGSATLNNILFVANTGLAATIAAGTALTVNDLSTTGTANLVLNTGTINVNGNIFLTNAGTGGGGTAIINIVGASNQTVDGSLLATNQNRLPIININKPGGTLSLVGVISFAANVTYTAGVIDPGTSTCVVTAGLNMTGTFALYNLSMNSTAGVNFNIAAGNTVTVLNDLVLSNGASTININTGTLEVQGNIFINNTGTVGGGTGTVLISGNNAQNIFSTGIINQGRLPAVTINKTGGTLVLPSMITVRGNWTYIAGTVDAATNNSTVVFANTLTITGSHTLNSIWFEAAANYTTTIAAGTVLTANGVMTLNNTNNLTFNGGNINLMGDLNLSNTGVGGGGTTIISFAGTANQAVNGALTINQSRLPSITINKPSGTLTLPALITVRGNWTYTTGLIDATTNNSTVVFGNTMSITGDHTLNNIYFDGNANYTYSFTGTTLTASGNMTIAGANNVTLNSGTINLNGNLNLTNTATAGGGTTVIAFVAPVNQTITSSVLINQSNLPAVNINKAGGTLTFPSVLTVLGNWTYTSGTMDLTTNNSTIAFNNSLSISGTHSLNNVTLEGNANYTYTFNSGTILTVMGNLSITGASNVSMNTPIAGTTAVWAQGDVTISNTGTGGGGTAAILINGTTAQALTSTAAAAQGRLPYLNIQKTSGTLSLSGIISESRDWTYISGTVDATTSTLVFGGNNLTINSAGMNFYNATVTSATSTLGNNLTVNNNLTINGTGVLAGGNNTINIAGNWTNRATAGFTESTSTVHFNGSALQTISTPGGENFANLVIDNSGGGIQLAANATVATTLNMTQGNIDLNNNIMTLGTSTANTGTLVRTIGTMTNTGSFRRWFNTAKIASGAIAGLFPVGTNTDYRPLSISNPTTGPATGGTITISYTDANTNSVVSFPDAPFTVVIRKDLNWNIATGNGLSGGSYDLSVQGTGFGTIGSLTDLRLTLANSVIGTTGANSGSISNPTITRTALAFANLTNSFFVGSINLNNTTLPVNYISFTAVEENGAIKLDWKTSAELNNDHFTAQRSVDGTKWEDLQTIDGSGNTNSVSSYTVYDQNPLSGISYYRIKQTDMDGRQSYSMIRTIDLNRTTINVYPNPATDYIIVSGKTTGKINVLLFNSSGQRMNIPMTGNDSKSTLYVSTLVPGIYFIQISQGSSNEVRKISITK